MAGNDVPSPATFLLTRNAALDLRRIHTRSLREWGEDVADPAISIKFAALVRDFEAWRKFVPHGIAVLTVQHQVRDIESLIADLTPALHAEVERLKRKAWLHPLAPAEVRISSGGQSAPGQPSATKLR